MSKAVTVDKLIEDMQVVVRDAEALLSATAAQTGEKVQEARARTEQSLRHAKARLATVQDDAMKQARVLAGEAEEYMRDNPWQATGIAAGVGLVLGLLIGRR